MGIDAMITTAIIEYLERNVTATLEELTKFTSFRVGRKVSDQVVRRAIDRNRHRIEIQLDAGIFKVSLKLF